MQKIAYLVMAIAVVGAIASQSTQRAYAATLVPLPAGITADGIAALNTPYSLGEQGDIYVCIVSTTRQITSLHLIDPDNVFYNYVGTPALPITLPSGANKCLHLQASDFGLTSGFNKVGDWTVAVDTLPGRTFMYEFTVTFMVVPESILGAITAVTAPLVALTGYRMLRQKRF
ncbi:MAG: hypothetical protein RMJ59_06410 [Candidatus Nitrosocaldus sp.]|nr:hypothetical protein [Candidatus Nitrosocaldus sp.]MDW8275992.1 hypothetical protein [Candidatus Nitrosocaldus sp.]